MEFLEVRPSVRNCGRQLRLCRAGNWGTGVPAVEGVTYADCSQGRLMAHRVSGSSGPFP